MAFAPMAFFLSAVYSESLYLALSIGLFWSAREGRWGYVGAPGGPRGGHAQRRLVLLAAGPDPLPLRAARGIARRTLRDCAQAPRPALARATGSAARGAVAGAGARRRRRCTGPTWRSPGGDALAPFNAQEAWSRHFAGPYVGVWDGLKAAFEGARQLLSFQRAHLYFPAGGEDPFVAASHNLILFAFLAAAVPAVVGVSAHAAARLRRLRAGGAGAAALLPGQLPAADVPAALPAGAVPAVHLARGLAGPHPRAQRRAGRSAAADGLSSERSSRPGTGWPSVSDPQARRLGPPPGTARLAAPAGAPPWTARRRHPPPMRTGPAALADTTWPPWTAPLALLAGAAADDHRSAAGRRAGGGPGGEDDQLAHARRARRSPTRSCRTCASSLGRALVRPARGPQGAPPGSSACAARRSGGGGAGHDRPAAGLRSSC